MCSHNLNAVAGMLLSYVMGVKDLFIILAYHAEYNVKGLYEEPTQKITTIDSFRDANDGAPHPTPESESIFVMVLNFSQKNIIWSGSASALFTHFSIAHRWTDQNLYS